MQSTSKDGVGWPTPHRSDRRNPDAKPSICTLRGGVEQVDTRAANCTNPVLTPVLKPF